MNEYRVKVTIRNNLLLSAIEAAGYRFQVDFARAAGISQAEFNQLVALRRAPIDHWSGEFSNTAKAIMETLGLAPTDLWTDKQLTMSLNKNTGERICSENEIQAMLENHAEQMTLPDPEQELMNKQRDALVNLALDSIAPRSAKILRMRYEQGMTYAEIAKLLNVSAPRVREIEARALRMLRHPTRSDSLRGQL
jgi:RNA polymerase sigma factor (sigma-70 family)